MTRVAALVFLTTLTASGLTGTVSSTKDTSVLATPAPAPVDVSAAVPVSLTIRNEGDAEDRLLGGHTPNASRVALHRTRLADGRWVMEAAPDGIAIPAGETLFLGPGGHHLMLMELRNDLVQGETFPLTLAFERAGEATVTVRVRRRVDAAGVTPFPPVMVGAVSVSLASAPPAPAAPRG